MFSEVNPVWYLLRLMLITNSHGNIGSRVINICFYIFLWFVFCGTTIDATLKRCYWSSIHFQYKHNVRATCDKPLTQICQWHYGISSIFRITQLQQHACSEQGVIYIWVYISLNYWLIPFHFPKKTVNFNLLVSYLDLPSCKLQR